MISLDKDKEPSEMATVKETSQIRITVDAGGENRFVLSGTLDAYLAGQLHRCAHDLLESGRDITVDLSEVDSMDVCTMQILLALRGDLVSRGRRFGLFAASEAAVSSLRMAGIAGLFALV
jgi:anti-anti-sigma factor